MVYSNMKWSVLTVVFTLVSWGLLAQQLDGSFVNYTFESGLTSSNTTCLAEDSTGFIWIGTEEGLNRFDGINFRQFLKDDGQGAVVGNYITIIHVLPDNRMLVGTKRGGICLYDPATELFQEFILTEERSEFAFRYVHDILPLDGDEFLIAYQQQSPYLGGLTLLSTQTMEQTPVFADVPKCTALLRDKSDPDKIWATGRDFMLLDLQSREVEIIEDPVRYTRRRNYYQQMEWIGDHIWIATWGSGIVSFNPDTREFNSELTYDPNNQRDSNRNAIRKFTADGEGNYWVNTADKGFGLLNMVDSTFAFYKHDASRANSIFHISSRDLLIDSRGLIWIAMAEGLSLRSPYVYQMKYKYIGWMEGSVNPRLFAYQQVQNVGDKWIVTSTSSNGFYVLDAETKEILGITGYDEIVDKGISGNTIRATRDGHVFTQYRGRLYEIDLLTDNAFPVVDLYGDLNLTGMPPSVNTLMTSGNDCWFGTDDNIVGVYHTQTEIYEHYTIDTIRIDGLNNLVYELDIANNGDVWIGASKGVYRFRDGVITHLSEISEEYKQLGALNLESLVVTEDLVVFGAMEKGLYTYNVVTNELTRYSRKDGLPNMRVAEMEVDTEGRVWGLTAAGMFSLDISKEDPLSVYNALDGLVATDLIRKEITALSSGEIVVGAGLGICYFHPDDLNPQPTPEKLIVAECVIDGLKQPGADFVSLEVDYDSRVDLTFQAIGFVKPESYQYYFRQSPDEPWSYLADPTLSFYSFPEGGMSLEVNASNERGEMMETPYLIQIDVKLPYYRTSWFAVLVFLMIVFLSYIIYTARLRRVKKEERVRARYQQRLVEVEMSALRAQMNPHFLFNCLNSIKFFIINKETDQASDYLTKFSRLIRLILTNSKSELIPLSGELEALDLYVDLESLRFDQQFEFDLQVAQGVQTEFIEVPPMIIQPFVENAIWHGLLHKKSAGRLLVDISIEGDHLVCIIEDDGIGRVKAAEMRSKTVSREKSMGMDITRNRLLRMEGGSETERQLSIEDLYHEDGSPAGTRIKMLIPIN